jgi:hypothetical protein
MPNARRTASVAHFTWALAATVACSVSDPPLAATSLELRQGSVVAAPDVGTACSDVGRWRACWDASCPSGICRVKRSLPRAPAATELGWRCTGAAAQRSCVDRILQAGKFRCEGERCTQAAPRLPNNSEWSCFERAGVVVCSGGQAAAGVTPTQIHPGWWCGARRGFETEQVCVDFSPDYPDASSAWECEYSTEAPTTRVCERVAARVTPHRLGASCDGRACVDGATCVDSVCLPPRPQPACILDRDCTADVCRFGSCVSRRLQ